MGKPLRLLHLSDLHLGDITTRFLDSAKYDVPTEVRSTAETAFSRGLSDARLQSVDKMFVSGDITIAGGASGFTEFERFIHTRVLRPGLVRSPSDICVVPGNHDVEWNLTGVDRYRRRFDLFSSTVERLGVSTCLLPVSEDRDLGLMFDDSSFLRPIHVDHERSLLILCLNSAVRCGEVDVRRRELLEKGLMREDAGLRTTLERDLTVHDIASVTSAQLERVVGSLQVMRSNLEDWDALFKVATLHHHLVPFSGQATEHKPFDAIVDAGPLLKRLDEFGFHLVLSGHKHQDYAVVHFGD